jgi:hypothetical protein
LVCKGYTAKESPLLVAPHVVLSFHLSPPFFFVAPVLLFHGSTHTMQDTHTKTKERKTKAKEE